MDPPPLLLTRPEAASRRFLGELEARAGRRLRAVVSPALALEPVAVEAPPPEALILTSEQGARRAGELGLGGRLAYCVGPRTAEAAREAGLEAREAGPDAEALVAALLRLGPPGRLLHLRGEHARGEVAARLREGGLDAGEAVAYRQAARGPSAEARALLGGEGPVALPLFSPRSAALVAGWGARAPLLVAAMSPAVAGAAAALRPGTLVVAARPDGAAMAEAVLPLLGLRAGARGTR